MLQNEIPEAWRAEYMVISSFYGRRAAKRSKFPLMRHIDDGLHILEQLGAGDLAKAAFCLHPIVQNSEALDVSWSSAYELACEYRDKANAYLCTTKTDWVSSRDDVITLVGTMSWRCRLMLIADKRQNYGDFLRAHYGKHERSEQLDKYFRLWLSYLEGTPEPSKIHIGYTSRKHLNLIVGPTDRVSNVYLPMHKNPGGLFTLPIYIDNYVSNH